MALESVRILDAAMLRDLQRDAVFQNTDMAAAYLTGAKADAMKAASANESDASALVAAILGKPSAGNSGWKCSCGMDNTGKFCTECGTKKP